jgi:hypothetical protein
MKKINVFAIAGVILLGLAVFSCSDKNAGGEEDKTTPVLQDPEGTVVLDMSTSEILLGQQVSILEGNFTGAQFVSLGKIEGLSAITTIPKKGWTNRIAVLEDNGYIAFINDRYWRLFVGTYQNGRTIVKYQEPFIGSETAITPEKTAVSMENPTGDPGTLTAQTVTFSNASLFPFSVAAGTVSEHWCSASPIATAENTPCDAIRITASQNMEMEPRTCTVTVKSEIGEDAVITVTQESGESRISLNQPDLYYTSAGAASVISVNSNTQWKPVSNATWCTVSPATGTKNAPATVSVTANGTNQERSATVTFTTTDNKSKAELLVRQNASYWSVSTTTIAFTPAASQATFTVNSDLTWSVNSSQTWCTLTKNNAAVTVTVTDNLSDMARDALITVSFSNGQNKTVTVTQASPTLSVSSSALNLPGSASQSSFTVTSNAPSWTATSSQTWCTVTKNTSSNPSVTVSATENLTGAERNAVVKVALSDNHYENVNVTQAKPTLSVSKTEIPLAGNASQSSFTVTTNLSSWTVTSNQTWCTVTKNAADVIVATTENLTGAERNAVVKVTLPDNQYIDIPVTQAKPTLSVSSSVLNLAGNASQSSFTVTSNLSSWMATSSQTWCTVTKNAANVSVAATENLTGTERNAVVKVALSDNHYVNVSVTQAKPTLSVSTSAVNFPKLANNSSSVNVSSNVSSWSFTTSQSWCTATKSGEALIISVTDNITGQVREATVTVSLPNDLQPIQVRQGAFEVGDYYNVGGVQGIVYQVSDDYFHGMIISLDETTAQWSKESVTTGANSPTDGSFNMDLIKARGNWEENYPAFKWCNDKNKGSATSWLLPASDQLHSTLAAIDAINNGLQIAGVNRIAATDLFWSSTENSLSQAYARSSVLPRPNMEKTNNYAVRCVMPL